MSWPLVKLSEVATLINGRAYKKHEMLSEGKYPLMRVGNFFSNREWYYSDLELPERQYCDKGDLLYAWSASFGPRIWEGEKVIYHYHIWKLALNEKLIDKKYMFYALQKDVEKIKQEQGSGSTMIHVTKTAMEDREIPLPPLEEQKRIAAILDKADAIRRKRQQAINLADDFLRSSFLDMFGDPVINPKGWEVKKVKNFAKVTTGNTPSRKESKYYGEDIEWIKSDNINTPEHILTTATEFLSLEGEKVARTVEKGSTLITCIAGSFDCIGNVAFADRKVSFNQQINALTPKRELVSDWFLYSLILFSKKLIQNASTNSMKGMVSKGKLEEVELILPPLEKQKEFEMIFNKQIKLKQKMSQSYLGSSDKFNSLSQKAFAGEL